MSNSPNAVVDETVYCRTRTISIVSDGMFSCIDDEEGYKTPQSMRSGPWPLSKSPSAASFFTITSEHFYDVMETSNPNSNISYIQRSEGPKNGLVNLAYVCDEKPNGVVVEDPSCRTETSEKYKYCLQTLQIVI